MSSRPRSRPGAVRRSCTGFKAAPPGRSGRQGRYCLQLTLPPGWPQRWSAGAKTSPVRGRSSNRQEATGAVADLAREPSRRPSSGYRGQAEASLTRQPAYGPPPLIKSIAPSGAAIVPDTYPNATCVIYLHWSRHCRERCARPPHVPHTLGD